MTSVAETAKLAHGFTMADVERSSRAAASKAYTSDALSWVEKYEIAWMAIVEEVYDRSEDRPSLLMVGLRAISQEANDYRRHHGYQVGRPGELELKPSVAAYWHKPGRGSDDFTATIVERLALPAVMATLTDIEIQTLSALAAHGSREKAAAALGIHPGTFSRRVSEARRHAQEAWFAPETPRDTISMRGRDEPTCRWGHPRSEFGFLVNGSPACRKCRREATRRSRVRNLEERRAQDRERAARKRAMESPEERETRLEQRRADYAKRTSA